MDSISEELKNLSENLFCCKKHLKTFFVILLNYLQLFKPKLDVVRLSGVKSKSDRAGKARAAELLSWILAFVVVRLCDRDMPDANWAEKLLFSKYKTYK